MSKTVVVYGSYGCTGALVARELVARGYEVVLGGRDGGQLARLNEVMGGNHRVAVAGIDDPSSLDRMLRGVFAVLNCAGPYTHTALSVASAAIRNRVHYLDPNAVEQMAAKRLFDELDGPARTAGVTVVPVMGILGGLGDVMADVAAEGVSDIADATVAYTIEGWIPTKGSQLTSKLQQPSKRLAFENGGFTETDPAQNIESFDFGPGIGPQPVLSQYPGSEMATLPRHVSAQRFAVKMAISTLQQFSSADPQWAAGIDAEARSKTRFTTVVEIKGSGTVKRLSASGNDIYGITAPFILNGLERLEAANRGVLSPSDAFGGQQLLGALRSHGFYCDFAPVTEEI